ncbi:TPA: potassium transporter peripheral membrane component, partial [Streptococcus suis]
NLAFCFSNLKILVPPLTYILGMKLESGRDRDKQDAGEIVKLEEIKSIKEIHQKLKEFGFHLDISIVLEVFEIAYGMKWLAKYLREHTEEFSQF